MPRSIWSFRKKLRDQGPNLIMVEKNLPSLFCKQHTLSFSVTKTFQLDLSAQIFVSLSGNWGKCTLLYTITYYFVHCLDLNATFFTVTLYLSKLQCYLSRDKQGRKWIQEFTLSSYIHRNAISTIILSNTYRKFRQSIRLKRQKGIHQLTSFVQSNMYIFKCVYCRPSPLQLPKNVIIIDS